MNLNKRSLLWLDKVNKTGLYLEVKNLIEGKSVDVGYRATCGCTDKTRKDYNIFMKFIAAIKSQGIIVTQNPVKHGNAYATNNGGFWISYIFNIENHKG